MKKVRTLYRILAVLETLSLALPAPVSALRPMSGEGSGLEELRDSFKGPWQRYESLAENLDQVKEISLDRLLPLPLRNAAPFRFFPVDQPVWIPTSLLQPGPLRVIPKLPLESFVEISLLGDENPRIRLRVQSAAEQPAISTASLGFRVKLLSREEGGGILLIPANGSVHLEYSPPELTLSLEELGTTAWIVSWIHRTMAEHYETEERLLLDGNISTLARIPLYPTGTGTPPVTVRISRGPLRGSEAFRKAVLEAYFPAGTWTPERLRRIQGSAAMKDKRVYFPVQFSGFETVRVEFRPAADGSLKIETEEQRVSQIFNTLRVLTRLVASLIMEKDPSLPPFEDFQDPAKWPLKRLESAAGQTVELEGRGRYLEKYMAIAALALRPEGGGALLEILEASLDPQGVVNRREPEGAFRLAAAVHLYRRHHEGTRELKFSDPFSRREAMYRFAELVVGEKKDPLSSIRLVALQAMARLAPKEDQPSQDLTWVLNILRQVRDDWTELPAIRWRAGELAEQLKSQREEGGGPSVKLTLGFPADLQFGALHEGASFIELRTPEQQDLFSLGMKALTSRGLERFEYRLSAEDSPREPDGKPADLMLLHLESELVPGQPELILFRGPLSDVSPDNLSPRATLRMEMNLMDKPWVQESLDRIFSGALDLEPGETLEGRITSLGHVHSTSVTLTHRGAGLFDVRTEELPVRDLADATALLIALSARVLGAGLEEAHGRIAKDLEALAAEGAGIIQRQADTTERWSRKWKDLEVHQEAALKRLAEVTLEQEKVPQIRVWIPHLMMHHVLLLVNRNLPMNWGPWDSIPDPDALEEDLYEALKLSDQILKRFSPRQRASQSEQSLRQTIRIQQAHIVATLSAAGMFKNVKTVQNALSDRELPTGYAFALLSETFRVYSESGTEPSPSKEAGYLKAMAYALMAALSSSEDYPMLDQYETMAFGPLLEFIPEDPRHPRPKEKFYGALNQVVKRRFGASLQPDARDSVMRVSESLRDEMLLASPAALLEVQGLAAWTLSDFFSAFRAIHLASAFRLLAEKTEKEMAEKRRALFRSYPAGRLAYQSLLRWEPLQVLTEEPEASGVMAWMNKNWGKMIPEPGVLSHVVFLTLRQEDPGIQGHVTLVRQGFPLGDRWKSRLRRFLQMHAGPFWVVADQEVKTGQRVLVITNVRPSPLDQPPVLTAGAEETPPLRIAKGVRLPDDLYGAAAPLKEEAVRLTNEIGSELARSPLFNSPSPVQVGDGRELGISGSWVLYSDPVFRSTLGQDARRVFAVHLYEVIQNAVDAIADRMEVERAIAGGSDVDYQGRIDVRVRREAGQVILEVLDNGIGIPNSFKEYLFGKQAFTSKEERTRAGGEGKGLGLFGLRLLQVLPGGRLEVETLSFNEEGLDPELKEAPWAVGYRASGGGMEAEDLPAPQRQEREFGTKFRWSWNAGLEELQIREYSRVDAGLHQRVLVITPPSAAVPDVALVLAHADLTASLLGKVPEGKIVHLMHPSTPTNVSVEMAEEFTHKTIRASFTDRENITVILNNKYVKTGEELDWIPEELRGKATLTVLNLPEALVKDEGFTRARLALLHAIAQRLGGVLSVSWVEFEGRFEGEQAILVYL